MTIPYERSRAVISMYDGVCNLSAEICRAFSARGYKNVTVPSWKLHSLYFAMKHFPSYFDIEESAKILPHIWGPLTTEVTNKNGQLSKTNTSKPVRKVATRKGKKGKLG